MRMAVDFEDKLLRKWKVNSADGASVSRLLNSLKDEIEGATLLSDASDAAWNLQGDAAVAIADSDDVADE